MLVLRRSVYGLNDAAPPGRLTENPAPDGRRRSRASGPSENVATEVGPVAQARLEPSRARRAWAVAMPALDAGGARPCRPTLLRVGVAFACAAAVGVSVPADATAAVYWGSFLGQISRANLDGSGLTESISRLEFSNICGVAVDRQYVYVAHSAGAIARVTIGGTVVPDPLIRDATTPCGVAVDATHIYWAERQFDQPGAGTIGRANLDGSGVRSPL